MQEQFCQPACKTLEDASCQHSSHYSRVTENQWMYVTIYSHIGITAESMVKVHSKVLFRTAATLLSERAKNLSTNGTDVLIGFEGRDKQAQKEGKAKIPITVKPVAKITIMRTTMKLMMSFLLTVVMTTFPHLGHG